MSLFDDIGMAKMQVEIAASELESDTISRELLSSVVYALSYQSKVIDELAKRVDALESREKF